MFRIPLALMACLICACPALPDPLETEETEATEPDQGQNAAVERVNLYRAAAGLEPVAGDDDLHRAAARHSRYTTENLSWNTSHGLSPHAEEPGRSHFSGVDPRERARSATFPKWESVGEVMHYLEDPARSVDDWMDTVYHRQPLMLPELRKVGFASVTGGPDGPVQTMDVEYPFADNARGYALWPPREGTDIRTTFNGLESPEPPEPPTGWPSGHPISISFSQWWKQDLVSVTTTSVRAGMVGLPHVVLEPKDDDQLTAGVFLYTHRPLPELTRVEVSVALKGPEGDVQEAWGFTTGCSEGEVHGVACEGNALVECTPDGPAQRDCGTAGCSQGMGYAVCGATEETACTQADGEALGCAGPNTLLVCMGGVKAGAPCGLFERCWQRRCRF